MEKAIGVLYPKNLPVYEALENIEIFNYKVKEVGKIGISTTFR